MIYSGTELKTTDDTISVGELLRYLKSSPEFKDMYKAFNKIEAIEDVIYSVSKATRELDTGPRVPKPHTHDVSEIENIDSYTKEEVEMLIEGATLLLKEKIESLKSNVNTMPEQSRKELTEAIKEAQTELSARIKKLEATPRTKEDNNRIAAIEKSQKELVVLIDGVIEKAEGELREVQEKLLLELSNRINESDKKVVISGGVNVGTKLKLLRDVKIINPTNGQALTYDTTLHKWVNSTASGGGHTIEDEGTPLTQRTNLNFVGAGVTVTDDAGGNATVVTIPGGSGGAVAWGDITGTLSDQTDLQTALDAKYDASNPAGYISSVSGGDHGSLAGLADDDHTQYALLAGRSGGQTLKGGTAVGDAINITGTSGNGTSSIASIKLNVGNNGATTSQYLYNSGQISYTAALDSSLFGKWQFLGTGTSVSTAPYIAIKNTTDDSNGKNGGIFTQTRMTSRYLQTAQNLGLNDNSFGNPGVIQWTAWEYSDNAYTTLATPIEFTGWSYQYYDGAAYQNLLRIHTSGVYIGAASAAAVPAAKMHVISTTEQARIGYDTSNYYSTTISSAGAVTLDAAGSGASFTFADRIINSTASVASTPAEILTGAIFTGGTGTTTTPHLLIQPSTATPSTVWSTSGTALGINTASGFSGSLFDFQVNGAARGSLTAAGALTCASNFLTLGNSTCGSSSSILWNSRSGMRSPSDGVIRLSNNADTDFTRLQLGGTTSSFPAIKRNSTAINFRLADDSADAAITALSYNKVAITAPATSSTITVADGKTFTASNTITLTGTDSVSANVSNLKLDSIGFTVDGGGSAITTGKVKGFFTCPYAGTITAYNIVADTGTCTIKCWKIATGTAKPTSSNSINTSGVQLSTGTAVHSTTLSDFTSTTVTANDIFAFNIEAISGATELSFNLEITRT